MDFPALSLIVPDPEKFRAEPPPLPAVWQLPPRPLAGLLRTADLDRLLGDGVLRQRMVSVVSGGKRVPGTRYTWANRPVQPGFADVVRAAAITELLAEGATVILESLHRTWRPIGDLCRRLSAEAGLSVGANAYLTPAASQGFAHHYDTHSVLIVQTSGSKTWQLHEPVFADPLEHQPWRPDAVSDEDWQRLRHGTPALETVLRPGDVLWIPRGWIHNGFATGEHSLHVTLGFPTISPYLLATQLVQRLDGFADLRRELPWGLTDDPARMEAAVEATVDALRRALDQVDPAGFAAHMTDQLRGYYLEPARSPVTAVLGGDPDPDTPVVTVAEAVVGTDALPGGRLRLHLADDTLTLDPAAARALAPRLEPAAIGPWCAGDLIGVLDSSGALALVAELLRAGVVRRWVA